LKTKKGVAREENGADGSYGAGREHKGG